MSKIIKLLFIFLLILTVTSYAQNNKKSAINKNNSKVPVNSNVNKQVNKIVNNSQVPGITGEQKLDYKIISSNANYIEVEFYPSFQPRRIIKYNGQNLDFITFNNAVESNASSFGQPDIRSRYLPIFLPSADKNVISVIDFDENNVNGINLTPVPNYKYKNSLLPKNFQNIIETYAKDPVAYSKNKFYPDNIAELSKPGIVRDNVIANIILNPYQYNPVTGVLKQYTRIRVRVNFSGSSVLLNRPRTLAEIHLLKGAAINSDVGINWINSKPVTSYRMSSVFNSVMSTGDWYRIQIQDNGYGASDGMYKITRSFLVNAGINLDNVDPRTIKMYGNGGNMLSATPSDPRPIDLTEIAIYVSSQSSGQFGPNDYILFYGSSVNNWVYDTTSGTFTHQIDYYSTSNYYWICFNSPNNGKRMQLLSSENNANAVVPSSFTEKLFYEPEVLNLNDEGNVWLSQSVGNGGSFVWNNTLTGLENNTTMLYKIKPASRVLDGYDNHMLISEANSTVSPIYFQMGNISPGYGDWIWTAITSFTINSSQKTNGEQSSFTATFYTTDPAGEGYLDWMEIQYSRRLNSVTGDYIRIVDTSNLVNPVTKEYNVSSFSSNQVMVFDASDHANLKIIQPLSVSASNVRFQKTPQTYVTKYFVIGPNGYKTPTSISPKLPNQNLHGISDGYDFIIISYPDFIPAANRLKAKREAPGPNDPSYLKTLIVDVTQIYNEFSGGLLDPVAIRDFLKYSYDNWQKRPSFVCFLGGGSYDYKNILQIDTNLQPPGSTFIPAYEFSDPNINQVNGYTSDDFFVQIEGDDPIPDIAHGRIPVWNLDEANEYMDKLDCYENGSTNGFWKDKIIYVADDGWTDGGDDGSQHTDQSEMLATEFTPSTIDQIKIYLIAYPPVITSAGRRKPAVNADIIKYWNEGAIAVNWVGHGAPDLWAHEYVFEKDVAIAQLNNVCMYPFVTVASCDFSKFDDPNDRCGSDLLTTKPREGAIGTMAATRPTYGELNSTFNNTVWNHLYGQRDTLLLQERIGEAVFQTKQSLYGQNDLKFELLCDPTVRDQYPRFRSRIDSISGLANDSMRALSKVKVYGSIMHPDSSFWSNYNGNITMIIFDVDRHISLTDENSFVFNFILPGGTIFSGSQNIKNGLWSMDFIVPRDISYQNQNGKLINYFYNSSYDGSSFYNNFIVGGIDPDAPVDTTGPTINLYLNNPNFRSGDVVNENFTLMANLYDLSGINTTGTIGHKIEAILNNDINNTYDLTPFYNSDTTYQSGHLSYAFTGMAPGTYNLKLRAWDTYNNPSEASIDFVVSLSSSLQVMNVYNFPNPFKDKTVFTFQHNYSNPINVKIKIYTVAGRLIKELTQNNIMDKFVAINWNGADQDGDKIANGIYIYKLTVETSDGASSVVSTGKLAVLK